MASELTELVDLANDNIRRERGNAASQTTMDDWQERLELDDILAAEAVKVSDGVSEPRGQWEDVVSYGPAAVIGFLIRKGYRDEPEVFS
jgi:hypothetical protein